MEMKLGAEIYEGGGFEGGMEMNELLFLWGGKGVLKNYVEVGMRWIDILLIYIVLWN